MKSYIKRLRALIGHRKFIHPAARILIENAAGEFLFIKRKDNGNWGIPAGAFEENESIEACIKREVKEETGLEVLQLEIIGISSKPENESVTYPNGDQIQYFTIEFYTSQWLGDPQADMIESKEVHFLPAEHAAQLPPNEYSAFQSLAYYRKTGKPLLK